MINAVDVVVIVVSVVADAINVVVFIPVVVDVTPVIVVAALSLSVELLL